MALWLKCGASELAFDNDIVPHEAFVQLGRLDDLAAAAQARACALLAQAEAHADTIRRQAETQAQAVAAKARLDASAVTRLGHAQGRRDALRHWHAAACRQRQASAALHGSQRERLADMVVHATASLLQGPALAAYLESALGALDGLAQKDLTLSVTVHPDDRAVAQAAIDRLCTQWRDGTVVKLIESPALAVGSCVCESPQGYIDASLSLQLASLRQAALGALDDLHLPDDVLAPEPPAPVPVLPTARPESARPAFPGRLALPGPYPLPFGDGFDDNGEDDEDDEDENFDDLFERDAAASPLAGLPLPGGPRGAW